MIKLLPNKLFTICLLIFFALNSCAKEGFVKKDKYALFVASFSLPVLLFFTSIIVRLAGGGELLQIVSGLLGLITGFVWVKHRMNHHDAGINVKPNEDFK